jgi:hypothetical protein
MIVNDPTHRLPFLLDQFWGTDQRGNQSQDMTNAHTATSLRQLEGCFQAGIDLSHRRCGKAADDPPDLRLCHRE